MSFESQARLTMDKEETMQTNAHVTARRALQAEAVERFAHITARTDWDALVAELFDKVVQNCPYGMGVLNKRKIMRWNRLIIRTNPMFEPSDATLFVRRMARVAHFDAIFKSTHGMERHEHYDLYKVVDARLGLPLNTLVYGIQHAEDPELRALLLFGGERLEGHMERSLELVERILAATPTNQTASRLPKPGPDDYGSYGELVAELRQINLKELDQMDLRDISELVNGLDAVIEYSPSTLRSKYRALNDHLLNRRRARWSPPA